MKKYISFLLILTFILGIFAIYAPSISAYDSGCTGAGPFSITTGQPCYNNYNNQNYGNNTYIPGCYNGAQYSTTTGQPCYGTQYSTQNYTNNNYVIPGCYNGAQYSITTGQSCYGSSQVNTGNNIITQQFQIGQRGADVKAFQKMLNNAGFSPGPIDGVYGPMTDQAYLAYQNQYGNQYSNNQPYVNSTCNPAVYPYYCGNPVNPTYPIYGTAPTVSGVSGPQSLGINQQGTWTVNAYSQNGGTLTYSVSWGDQQVYPYLNNNSNLNYQFQQYATFTHNYLQAGTYTVVFTVTNSTGQTAQTSLSIIVGGGTISTQVPAIYSFYAVPLTVTAGQTSTITWASNNATTCGLTAYPTSSYNPNNMNQLSGSAQFTPYQTTTYTLTCSNYLGQSDSKTVTVTVLSSSSAQAPTIYSLSPTSGSAGSLVTIFGTGFSNNCNLYPYNCSNSYSTSTVNFGSITIPNIYSTNGTSMTFTVPYNTHGTYPVSVTNSSSISNSVNFSVY